MVGLRRTAPIEPTKRERLRVTKVKTNSGSVSTKAGWAGTATLKDALGHGLTEAEFRGLCDALHRDFSVLELGIAAALYSEHCSYKSTKVHLKNLPTTGERVIQGPGENAGVVDIGDGEAVVFKVESHNHPSFIEPFQGAATGVGGILRDVFTMGARPLALMNGLRFGEPENSRTSYLLRRAVAGIGGYGNCVGVPTVGGELYFHKSYNGNCLVNAFALGVADQDKIFLGRAAGIGNKVIYFGSKTGRDGIRGAIMASEGFNENSDEKRPTVQVGDPFQEKLLIEATLDLMQSGTVIGIQDMGAAGMTCACFEMAERAGTGLKVYLDKVPQRETEMSPYEIMLSESQERMLAVVQRGSEARVIDLLKRWELDAVEIGEVVEGGNVDLIWQGETVSSIPAALLTASVPQYRWPEAAPADAELKASIDLDAIEEPSAEKLSKVWLQLLNSVNGGSRSGVFEQYDSTVRSNTVVHPGGDAAVIRVKNNQSRRIRALPEKALAMTLDCNSLYCDIDPRRGVALSLAEAIRNLAAVGAEPLALSDCLNFGSPERAQSMWQIAESIRGLGEAARTFNVPIVSGNVSLYNETKGEPVLPTPTLAVVGLIEDASKAITIGFKANGDCIFLIGETLPSELGGSLYLSAVHGIERGALPRLDFDRELDTAHVVRTLISERVLCSCHDLSSGGLGIALAECCFTAPPSVLCGAELTLSSPVGRKDGLLFAESGARYLISCSPQNRTKVLKMLQDAQIPVTGEGVVGGSAITITGVAQVPFTAARQAWGSALDRLLERETL